MRLSNFVVCLGVLLTAPAFSQTLGEITGQVTDATGAAVPGAKITATNVGTNATRDAVIGRRTLGPPQAGGLHVSTIRLTGRGRVGRRGESDYPE